MEGPRSPAEKEWPSVVEFLNTNLRSENNWSITKEYPTALNLTNLHNVRIITDEEKKIVSHAVMKPLIIKSPHLIFKAGAIGSVVTQESARNQGLSRQIIDDCLASAKTQSCDIAILWTNLFDFYRKAGFELAGYEISLLVDQNFSAPDQSLKFMTNAKVAPEAIHRLYSQHTVGTVRNIEDIRKFLSIPKTQVYTAWEPSGQLAAYAIEGKGADLGGYIHEWGGGVTKLLALFNYIQKQKGDTLTVIAPAHSQNLIRAMEAHGAGKNTGYLGMLKIVNFDQLAGKIKRAFRAVGVGDIVLEKQRDHFVFGCGPDFCTMQNETDMMHILFGPVDFAELEIFEPETVEKLNRVLPLQFWVWGWDSI